MKNIEKEINKVRLKLKVGTKEQTNFSVQKNLGKSQFFREILRKKIEKNVHF